MKKYKHGNYTAIASYLEVIQKQTSPAFHYITEWTLSHNEAFHFTQYGLITSWCGDAISVRAINQNLYSIYVSAQGLFSVIMKTNPARLMKTVTFTTAIYHITIRCNSVSWNAQGVCDLPRKQEEFRSVRWLYMFTTRLIKLTRAIIKVQPLADPHT